MECNTEVILDLLVAAISKIPEVQSVGISGGKLPLSKAGEGDMDIFIYCDMIPELDKRHEVMEQLEGLLVKQEINALHGGHWGEGDFAVINGVETWLMYFTLDETMDEIDSIIKGELPDKLDNYYYPVGRCAMFTRMGILYDKNGFLKALKEKLNAYPDKLAEILIKYHLEELEDTEDLERAAGRKDILFYHFALDIAIDHFLQAMFALNRVYFPSRKRSLEFIEQFEMRPVNCGERLLEVISLGSTKEGIGQSYKAWSILVNELRKIITLSFLAGFACNNIPDQRSEIMERTLVIIKPDAMERKLMGQVISAYEKKGLDIKAIKILKPSAELGEKHYAEHRDKPFFREVVGSITRREVCVMIIEGDEVIAQVRSINGATDPRAAEPGTIRALYGVSKTENTVHASDSPESAEREIKLWFPEL